ncbi:MAG: type II secretion system F family protein [Desulfobacterales bacterium]|jgi:type II secretory pathway component PulF
MAININPKSILEASAATPSVVESRTKQSLGLGFLRCFGKSVKSREVMFFTSQLSLMLEIQTPLTKALKAIGDEIKNPEFKSVVATLNRDVEEGRQLSEALKRHPRVFDNKFVSMVKAGEIGGFLETILDRIVEMQEKRQALITQLRSALTYPAVLCAFGFLVIVFILVFVLPKFTAFFVGKESILPWTTRFLMAASASLQHYWWVYILVLIGTVLGFTAWGKSKQGRALIDRFFISGPLISGLSNKIYTCEMLRTLGYLMESQVPLLKAIEVTTPTIWNQYYRRFLEKIKDTVDQGGRFAQIFSDYSYIPQTVKQMVTIGEEVGKLPMVMLRLARFYDTEIEQEFKKFAAMIEPIALIIMGGIVGLIISSIVLPMFKLSQALH